MFPYSLPLSYFPISMLFPLVCLIIVYDISFFIYVKQIPNVSPTGRYSTAMPLSIVLFLTAMKEIVEDVVRKSNGLSFSEKWL